MAVITTLGVPDNAGNTTTIMPKLQYRFRATFIGSAFSSTPTRSVISATRPSLTHEDIILDSYNSKIYLAGKHSWDMVTVTFRDDVDSVVIKELNKQLNMQVDHANQSSSRSGSAYKFQFVLEALDGASPTPGVLDKFELAGCYIQNINYGDMAYGVSEQVQVSVQIRYDNAEIYDAAGNATLTGATLDQTLSNATGGGSQG
jgi:hypothetical protein|tara:strand:- start:1327 stop:1932 length:606 start_codon:yes stop_codon:yes gene_type:complete